MLQKLILRTGIFAGLALLGWGPDDVAGFIAEPPRLAYLASIGSILAVATIWYPEATGNSGDGRKLVGRQRWVVRWLQAVSLALAIAAPYCDRRDIGVFGAAGSVRYVGLGLSIPGFLLMLWARVALGRQFSLQVTVQEGHRLVTGGLYRHVRHPRYAGILLFLAGTALIYRSWWALVLVAATAVMLLWRIRDEEVLMRHEFGSEWEAYCRKTWRLVPFIY